jgi:hypothetical protein
MPPQRDAFRHREVRQQSILAAELKAAVPGDILKFSTNGSQTVFASGIRQLHGNGGPEFLAFRGGPTLP